MSAPDVSREALVRCSAWLGAGWKWFNRAAIIGFLLLFRQAVLRGDVQMQWVWAALVVGNAWCHWKGKALNGELADSLRPNHDKHPTT